MVSGEGDRVEKWLVEAAFPLWPAIVFGFIFGAWAAILGLILSPLLWLVGATPVRIVIEGPSVHLDFLPFGWYRRTFEGRTLSYEVRMKSLEIGVPERVLVWHEEVRVARPGDMKLRAALEAAGATRIRSAP